MKAVCELCGEPMPKGEEMFKYHGYSGDCPKPPLPPKKQNWEREFENVKDFIRSELTKARKEERKKVIEEIEKFKQKLNVYDMSSGAIDDDNGMLIDLIADCRDFLDLLQQEDKKE